MHNNDDDGRWRFIGPDNDDGEEVRSQLQLDRLLLLTTLLGMPLPLTLPAAAGGCRCSRRRRNGWIAIADRDAAADDDDTKNAASEKPAAAEQWDVDVVEKRVTMRSALPATTAAGA
jgi:hypothetical protein